MNSTGKELSQADLIRNFILMGLEPELQTRLYEDYWDLWRKSSGKKLGEYRYLHARYLTMKKGKVPKKNEVYDVFKQFSRMVEAAQKKVKRPSLWCRHQNVCRLLLKMTQVKSQMQS